MICRCCEEGDHGYCEDGTPHETKDGVVLCDCATKGHGATEQ